MEGTNYGFNIDDIENANLNPVDEIIPPVKEVRLKHFITLHPF